ncbi:hypothetical protein [Pseudonocardia xishanensis]|uniref:Uncharacterized protein n=1 Tax=Pseudonocardia xishanensis TaxID=630995 RepID=A0ABP8RML8_9PSEU
MSISPQAAPPSSATPSAEPTVRLPHVPESPLEHELAAARARIAADPTLVGLPTDAHLHTRHPAGMVFAHGRRLTVVEVHENVDDAVMSALVAHRAGLAGRRNEAVVVARRMNVAAARRCRQAGVHFVPLRDVVAGK